MTLILMLTELFDTARVEMSSLLKLQARTKDRISSLPDVLVCHILSLLATKYAVRTTILSKRWKNLWTSVPRLDVSDERDFRINVDGSDRFATFVSRVLELHDSDFHKFCLVMLYPHDSTRIGDWIFSAVRRNVVELDLYIYDDTGEMTFQMPECVFTCKTLIALKLNVWSCYATVDPPTFGCFPNLKFLHAMVSDPDEDSIEKLFSCCLVIEDLTIDGQIEYDTTDIVYSFKVSTLELKTLRIYLEGVDILVDVYINAPKLENFELKEVGLSNYYYLTGSANSLVNASIAFRDFKGEKLPYFSNRPIALMDEVRNVKYLSLSAHFVEVSIPKLLLLYNILQSKDYRMKEFIFFSSIVSKLDKLKE